MKRIWIVIALLCSLLVLASCGGGGGGGGDDDDYNADNLSALASMNITDAKSIFIRSESGSANSVGLNSPAKSSASKDTSKMYKIDDSNNIVEVSFFDKSSNKITLRYDGNEMVPTYIENINENYIAVGFTTISFIEQGYTSPIVVVLARKSDGAIFKLKDLPVPVSGVSGEIIKSNSIFSSDGLGNLYYNTYLTKDNGMSVGMRIIKLSAIGSNMESAIITPSIIEQINCFDADSKGNLFWKGRSHLLMTDFNKILPAGGGDYVDLPESSCYWKEQDGKIHYIKDLDVKMINPDTLASETYGSFTEDHGGGEYKISLQGYTYLISSGGIILEVYNPGSNPRSITLGGLAISNVYGVVATENYYFIAGADTSSNNFLIRVSPGGTSYISILGNEYRIYAFTASESDGITFNALRNNDLKKVMGKVSINGGVLTILDDESNTQVTFLERIR